MYDQPPRKFVLEVENHFNNPIEAYSIPLFLAQFILVTGDDPQTSFVSFNGALLRPSNLQRVHRGTTSHSLLVLSGIHGISADR
jgi:hypothetical protein